MSSVACMQTINCIFWSGILCMYVFAPEFAGDLNSMCLGLRFIHFQFIRFQHNKRAMYVYGKCMLQVSWG